MKKENKKMAQERRAAERAKAAKRKKINGILAWAIPAVIIAALVIWIIASAVAEKKNNSEDSTEAVEETTNGTETAETTSDGSTTLNTTEGLEAEDGDTVNIAFTGYLDGEAFEGGSADSYDLTLGSGSFIDGFEDGVVGHTVGETFDLDLTFPENYGKSELAGQDVVFTVTLNGIYK